MRFQPRVDPLEASLFFEDGQSARPPVDGTVPRAEEPRPSTRRADLLRGRERYGIYCLPCHGVAGYGDGMIVQRGFRTPPSFHDDRLRRAPDRHLFDVITLGFGAMPPYAPQIPVQDRWRIVGYVRALQRSQNARLKDVAPEERERLR